MFPSRINEALALGDALAAWRKVLSARHSERYLMLVKTGGHHTDLVCAYYRATRNGRI